MKIYESRDDLDALKDILQELNSDESLECSRRNLLTMMCNKAIDLILEDFEHYLEQFYVQDSTLSAAIQKLKQQKS